MSQMHEKPPGGDPWGAAGNLISRLALDRRYWLLPLAFWTLLVGSSLWWNWQASERHAVELAASKASDITATIEALRAWNARHGGVYVWTDGSTRPNPYLLHPERDLELGDGRQLTMVNPAFMTRELIEILRDSVGIRVHLTSLHPINPGNQPDPWEATALRAFEAGEQSARTELVGGSDPMLRYMRPLRTEQSCLQCHVTARDVVGSLRGGISVAFAPDQLLALQGQARGRLVGLHLLVWLLLTATSLALLARLRQHLLSLRQASLQQDALVERRTDELQREVGERRQAQQWLLSLIDASGAGVLVVDRHGNCTLCNPVAAELLGYTGEALLGQPLRDLIAHSDAEGRPIDVRQCRLLRSYRSGEATQELDAVFWRADGRPLPVEYRARPVLADDGLPAGAVISFIDISERQAREARLRSLAAGIEHSPAATVIFNSDGIVEYVNPAFCRLKGCAEEALLGQPFELPHEPEAPAPPAQELWRTLRDGACWRGVLSSRRCDGRPSWERLSISPIIDGQGRTTHAVAICEDVTEEKQRAESAWRRANFDALTGLANRSLFRDRLSQQLAAAARQRQLLAVLYIDLDGFKQVNDGLGHDAGDALLREAGTRILGCLRASDTAARLGGDEFAIILPAINAAEEAEIVAERLIATLGQRFALGGSSGHVSASLGIALYAGEPGDLEELLRRADSAMYAAKRAGGGRFRHYRDAAG